MRFPFGQDYKQEKILWLKKQKNSIWLEGTPSNSLNVSNQLSIHEDTSYMRDYVFEEGRLKEVHFDKVSK